MVSRASSVIVVIRLPISCVSSVAISWHVPAVSMANGWKMCVVANLEYLSILFCAVLWAAAPGLVAVLPMYGTQHTLLLLTRSVNKKAVEELKLVRNCATRVFPVILFSSVPPTCIDITALLWRSCLFNVTRDSPIVQSRTERNQISDSPLFQCESLNLCTSLPKSAVICFTCFFCREFSFFLADRVKSGPAVKFVVKPDCQRFYEGDQKVLQLHTLINKVVKINYSLMKIRY